MRDKKNTLKYNISEERHPLIQRLGGRLTISFNVHAYWFCSL